MVFSSITFIFYFLPLVLVAYYLSPKNIRDGVLLAASFLFYGWGDLFSVVFLLLSISVNCWLGVKLEQAREQERRGFLIIGVGANLVMLGYFKYAGFLSEVLATVVGWVGLSFPRVDAPTLPLGISFFTFQAISYLIDVYRRDVPVERSFKNVALYIALFPHLIAGPIVRFKAVVEDLHQRKLSPENFNTGMKWFVLGLAQKTLVANVLAFPADQIFALDSSQLTTALAWLGLASYTLQIYFDFAGYSSMAIGLALMLGIRFPQNFNYPYIADSVTEFWRRWHMALSAWFKDYLYIPLGGNRVPPWKVYRNLLIVFILCGVWHGAGYTFLIWGMYHGGLLIAERAGLSRILGYLTKPVRHMYTLLAVMVGWVFFRADTLLEGMDYLRALAGFGKGTAYVTEYFHATEAMMLCLGGIFAVPIRPWLEKRLLELKGNVMPLVARVGWAIGMVNLAFAAAVMLASGTYNPFIYFRF